MGLLEILAQIPAIAYVLLAAGVILAVIELCIPGFGICGTGAIIFFIASVVFAAKSVAAGIVFGVIVLLIVAAILVAFSIMASKGKFVKPLVLKDSLGSKEGYSSSRDFAFLLGKEGCARSTLRPAGRVEINGKTYDVVTSGEFIEGDTPVRVTEVSGSRIVVEKVQGDVPCIKNNKKGEKTCPALHSLFLL